MEKQRKWNQVVQDVPFHFMHNFVDISDNKVEDLNCPKSQSWFANLPDYDNFCRNNKRCDYPVYKNATELDRVHGGKTFVNKIHSRGFWYSIIDKLITKWINHFGWGMEMNWVFKWELNPL